MPRCPILYSPDVSGQGRSNSVWVIGEIAERTSALLSSLGCDWVAIGRARASELAEDVCQARVGTRKTASLPPSGTRQRMPDAVLAASSGEIGLAARLAEALGMGSGSGWGETAVGLADRAGMRSRLEQAGVPQPAFAVAESLQAVADGAARIGLPVAVVGRGDPWGRVERRVDYAADSPLAWMQVTKGQAEPPRAVVEALVPGRRFHVHGWVVDGRSSMAFIEELEMRHEPHRFAVGAVCPAEMAPDGSAEMETVARAAVEALGYGQGTWCVDLCLAEEGPLVMAVRGGALELAECPELAGAAGLPDPRENALRIAAGDKPVLEERSLRSVVCCWLRSRSGRVVAIEGVDEARSMEGMETVRVAVQIGDTVGHVLDAPSRDRLGYVVAAGADVEEAKGIASAASERIRVMTQAVF